MFFLQKFFNLHPVDFLLLSCYGPLSFLQYSLKPPIFFSISSVSHFNCLMFEIIFRTEKKIRQNIPDKPNKTRLQQKNPDTPFIKRQQPTPYTAHDTYIALYQPLCYSWLSFRNFLKFIILSVLFSKKTRMKKYRD